MTTCKCTNKGKMVKRIYLAAFLTGMLCFASCENKTADQVPTVAPAVTYTPIPTATPVPTEPVPTVTLAPTATPVPTVTPAPTVTPVPTDTPVPTATPTDTPLPTLTPTSVPEYPCDLYARMYTIWLRKMPSSKGPTVDSTTLVLYSGTKMTALDRIYDKGTKKWWIKVLYNGEEYYAKPEHVAFSYFECDEARLSIVDPADKRYTYEDMQQDLKELSAKYPNNFSCESVAKTLDDRDIYVCTIGNREADKFIFLTATTHGREFMTSWLVMRQAEFYLEYMDEGFYEDKTYSELFEDVCVVLMPMLNPDGAAISAAGSNLAIRDPELRDAIRDMYESDLASGICPSNRGFSTYCSRWKANARGVDLNRNYPYGWEETNENPNPGCEDYKGETPFSEIETQAQKAVLDKYMSEKTLLAAISYHATGRAMTWDVAGTEANKEGCEKLTSIINLLTDYKVNLAEKFASNGKTLSLAGFTDWMNNEEIAPTVTVEVERASVFIPNTSEMDIDEVWAENREIWPGVIYTFTE